MRSNAKGSKGWLRYKRNNSSRSVVLLSHKGRAGISSLMSNLNEGHFGSLQRTTQHRGRRKRLLDKLYKLSGTWKSGEPRRLMKRLAAAYSSLKVIRNGVSGLRLRLTKYMVLYTTSSRSSMRDRVTFFDFAFACSWPSTSSRR